MKEAVNKILPVAMFIAAIGLAFKLMHWPGANVLIILGFSSVALYGMLRTTLEQDIASKTGGFTIAALALGFLFKIMHWPSANVLLAMALVLGIISMLLIQKEKKED